MGMSLPGGSSYFSAPSTHLDPNLFEPTEKVRPAVRALIVNGLFSFWRERHVAAPHAWAQLYLAGSGASYQWSASRSEGAMPGDLDVLIGIDWESFYAHQSADEMRLAPPDTVAEALNGDLHRLLWPRTAATRIGHGVYELTYYINPLIGPIQAIHPYAAYNLTLDSWAVRPDPHPVHPQVGADYAAVEADHRLATDLAARYDEAFNAVVAAYQSPVGAPGIINAEVGRALLVRRAATLLEEIHSARSGAFSTLGQGYADNANFRWQAAKANGTIAALRRMAARGPGLAPQPERASDQLHQRAVEQAIRNRP